MALLRRVFCGRFLVRKRSWDKKLEEFLFHLVTGGTPLGENLCNDCLICELENAAVMIMTASWDWCQVTDAGYFVPGDRNEVFQRACSLGHADSNGAICRWRSCGVPWISRVDYALCRQERCESCVSLCGVSLAVWKMLNVETVPNVIRSFLPK